MLQLEEKLTTTAIVCTEGPAHEVRHGPAFSVGAALGIVCLGALAVCIVILPVKIKSTVGGNGAELRARARLRQVIQDNLAEEIPQEATELDPEKPQQLHNSNTVPGGKVADDGTDDLRFGRWLVAKGKVEAAIPYYRKYLHLDPDRVSVRLELIDAYIATKRTFEARLMCIRTIKKQLRDADNAAVWQRLSKCQTN